MAGLGVVESFDVVVVVDVVATRRRGRAAAACDRHVASSAPTSSGQAGRPATQRSYHALTL